MDLVTRIAHWLLEAKSAVAFTGAGISTESGIPDFRSPNGIWAQTQPVLFQDFLTSPEARYEFWRQKAAAQPDFERALPNLGHEVLARWEQRGLIRGVITQNIDGLHQLAGSKTVWELHGTAREVMCLSCLHRFPAAPWVATFLDTDAVPHCPDCGGMLKHATVSFGQSLPHEVMRDASRAAQNTDLMLALGSSLVVYPAAGLPELARNRGARLVIVNRTETPLDSIADAVLTAELGPTLGAIDRQVQLLADTESG